jgi:hypothetical protein
LTKRPIFCVGGDAEGPSFSSRSFSVGDEDDDATTTTLCATRARNDAARAREREDAARRTGAPVVEGVDRANMACRTIAPESVTR